MVSQGNPKVPRVEIIITAIRNFTNLEKKKKNIELGKHSFPFEKPITTRRSPAVFTAF